jgi:hypothetical protein
MVQKRTGAAINLVGKCLMHEGLGPAAWDLRFVEPLMTGPTQTCSATTTARCTTQSARLARVSSQ